MSEATRWPDPRLADWVDGTLAPREHERFVAELRVNPQLRADLAAYERTVAALRAARALAPADAASAAGERMAERVLAALAQPAARPTFGRRGVAGWAWGLSLAAAVLACAFLVDRLADGPGRQAVAQTASGDAAAGVEGGASAARDAVLPGELDAAASGEALLPHEAAERARPDAAGTFRDKLGGEVATGGTVSTAAPAEGAAEPGAQRRGQAAPGATPPAPPAGDREWGALRLQVGAPVPPTGSLPELETSARSADERAVGKPQIDPVRAPEVADQPAFDSARWNSAVGLGGAPDARLPDAGVRAGANGAPAATSPGPGSGGEALLEVLPEVRLMLPAREAAARAVREVLAAERAREQAPGAAVLEPRWVEFQAPAARTGSDDYYLGARRRQDAAADGEVWLLEGSREQVALVLGRLAATAKEHGAVLQQGEVQVPPAVVAGAFGGVLPGTKAAAGDQPGAPTSAPERAGDGQRGGAGTSRSAPTARARGAAPEGARPPVAPTGPATPGPATPGPATPGAVPAGPATGGAAPAGPATAGPSAKGAFGGNPPAGEPQPRSGDRMRVVVRLQPALR